MAANPHAPAKYIAAVPQRADGIADRGGTDRRCDGLYAMLRDGTTYQPQAATAA